MTDQIVITEKDPARAKGYSAPLSGSRYGGHPSGRGPSVSICSNRRMWLAGLESAGPQSFCGPRAFTATRPAEGGKTKLAKLKVDSRGHCAFGQNGLWLATGTAIARVSSSARKFLEHYQYRGQIMRVLFTAAGFAGRSAKHSPGRSPNSEYASPLRPLLVARRAGPDQNL